jgi:hypothetical protein
MSSIPPWPTSRARNAGGLPRTADGKVDFSRDFFSKPAYLTVSGQLNGEYYACALSNIYTFGASAHAACTYGMRSGGGFGSRGVLRGLARAFKYVVRCLPMQLPRFAQLATRAKLCCQR